MLVGEPRPTVATVVDPRDRPRLDAAAGGRFRTIHAESFADAIRAVRERPVQAVLVMDSLTKTKNVSLGLIDQTGTMYATGGVSQNVTLACTALRWVQCRCGCQWHARAGVDGGREETGPDLR